MKVRYIKHPETIYYSNSFNLSSNSEIIFANEDFGYDSDFIEKFEVLINDNWVLLTDAFKNSDLITDNHNTRFCKPLNDEDRKRGYFI